MGIAVWLAKAATGWAFLGLFVFLPLAVFCWAIKCTDRKAVASGTVENKIFDYCYGGLSWGVVITSTIGSLISVGSVFNASIGASFFAGNSTYWGWLLGLLMGPYVFYLMITSSQVENFFKHDGTDEGAKKARIKMATVLRYISSNYGGATHMVIGIVFIAILIFLGVLELGLLLIWVEKLLGSQFSEPWLLVLLWTTGIFGYVFLGGYRLVLETDRLQFGLLFCAMILIAFILIQMLPGLNLLEALRDYFRLYAINDDNYREILAHRHVDEVVINTVSVWQLNIIPAFGAFFAASLWLICAPDIWNRFTTYMYLTPGTETNAPQKRRPSRFRNPHILIILVIVVFMIFLSNLLTALLGNYAFEHQLTLGIDNALESPYESVRYVLGYLGGLDTTGLKVISFLSDQVGVLLLVLVLLVLSLIAMTTLDTMIITGVQVYHDWRQSDERNDSNRHTLARYQKIAMVSTGLVVALVYIPYFAIEDQVLFHKYILFIGIGVLGNLVPLLTVALVLRTGLPHLFQQQPKLYMAALAAPLVLGNAGCAWFFIHDMFVGPLVFVKSLGLVSGSIFLFMLLLYVISILVFAAIGKLSTWRNP